MKDFACPMHPKAPLIVGVAIVIITLLGMYGMHWLLWLDVVAGAALIYLGVTGKCYLSGLMAKCCGGKCAPKTDEGSDI